MMYFIQLLEDIISDIVIPYLMTKSVFCDVDQFEFRLISCMYRKLNGWATSSRPANKI